MITINHAKTPPPPSPPVYIMQANKLVGLRVCPDTKLKLDSVPHSKVVRVKGLANAQGNLGRNQPTKPIQSLSHSPSVVCVFVCAIAKIA